jgi:ribosomal protein L15E
MDDNLYDAREVNPIRTSNQGMRSNPSYQKMVYDDKNQKAFRVTTSNANKSRGMGALSKQRVV